MYGYVYGYLIVNSDSYKDQTIEFPGAVVTSGCVLTISMFWEQNSDPLQE